MTTLTHWYDVSRYSPLPKALAVSNLLSDIQLAMTHGSIPQEIRESRGLTDTLLRLSVGIEDVEDILADLQWALE